MSSASADPEIKRNLLPFYGSTDITWIKSPYKPENSHTLWLVEWKVELSNGKADIKRGKTTSRWRVEYLASQRMHIIGWPIPAADLAVGKHKQDLDVGMYGEWKFNDGTTNCESDALVQPIL